VFELITFVFIIARFSAAPCKIAPCRGDVDPRITKYRLV